MKKYDVIVVGGGAAGLMAAEAAAESGRSVVVIEKMERPARKLRITGKGRCNLTNMAPVSEFIEHFGRNGRFLRQAFSQFFSSDLITFFEKLNIRVVKERGERVFPESGKAQDVVDALVRRVKDSGVDIVTRSAVKKLLIENGCVKAVKTVDGIEFSAEKVIVTTGGSSYPLTGSTGDGYTMAEDAGHTVVPVRPALVPLKSSDVPKGTLTDLNLRNVKATVFIDNKKKNEEFGEVVFTDSGLSGPIILTISSMVVDAIDSGRSATVSLDLKPALDEKRLDRRLLRDIDKKGSIDFRTLLNGLLPMKMIPFCIKRVKIDPDKKINQLSSKERKTLKNWLKNSIFKIDGYHLIDEAIVTAGGVSLKEINPKTMESKLIRGLYFAGEVLDLNGDTGGYNLQAAFSTGWVAGISVIE